MQPQAPPHSSPEVVDAQISRCAEARSDVDRLKVEVDELKALAHPRAAFAAALFELDQARKGDPDARAAMLEVADSLLAFWKDKSGPVLASSHPALEELWSDAVALLSGFQHKRFQRQLDRLWEARADAPLLAERVAELGQDDDRRAEFARCLYHLELARQFVDGSRAEFARRAALLQEAYLDQAVADELVGGDQGLAHLWGELIPYLDEFFETLEQRAAEAARAAADALDSGDRTQPDGAEPAVTAPPPAATPGDGHLPLPAATPYKSGEHAPGQATLPPGTRFPAPRDTAPPPRSTEPQAPAFSSPAPPPMPPELEPSTAPQVSVVTAPHELPETPAAPGPRTGWAEEWAGVASLRPSSPRPPAPPAEPQHVTQPIEVPEGEVIDAVEELSTTLPPDRPPPPPLSDTLPPDTLAKTLLEPPPPPPSDTIPPDLRQTFVGPGDSETLDPDLVTEAPPPPPRESVPPRLASSPALDVVEDDEPEPGPVTQAFWRGTEVALGLLPPADAPRVNTRVFAADHRNERKKLTNYLEDVKTRFTEAEVPESRAFQCLLKLYLAAHLKEKTLFGQKNEKRAQGFREALQLLGNDPMAAAHCAVWFELDGPHTLEKLHESLEVLADYLQFCARENLDPLAPTSPRLFL